MDLLEKAKKIKTSSIVGIVLTCTIILYLGGLIIAIVNGCKILGEDWKDDKLNDSKTLWGILTFVLLGNIASLVFGCKAIKRYSSGTTSI